MPTATLAEDAAPVADSPRTADPLEAIWNEIKGYHAEILNFQSMEPDQVLLAISGYAARCSEIRAHLARSQSRAATSFKANIVEPILNDLDFQYRLHSRVQAIRDFDLRLSGGQT